MSDQKINLTLSETIALFRARLQNLSDNVGDLALLQTDADSAGLGGLVGAINELDSDLHGPSGGSAKIDLSTTAKTIVDAINEHDAELGTITSLAMGTSASTVSAAIAELHDSLGDALLTTSSSQVKEAINEHDTELGTITPVAMETIAGTVSGAIAELSRSIAQLDSDSIVADTRVGSLAALDTNLDNVSIVNAINSLNEISSTGTINQTLRHNGTEMVPTSNLTVTSGGLTTVTGSLTVTNALTVDSAAVDTLSVTTGLTVPDNSIALGTKTTGNYVGTLSASDGISTTGASSGEGIVHALTNTDKGSSQNIFKRVIPENDAGTDLGTIEADTNNDALFIRSGQVDATAGISLGVDVSNDRITISHANTSSQASVNNSGTTYIQDITLDTYGHITAIASATLPTYDNYVSWIAQDGDGTNVTMSSGKYLKFNENNTAGNVAININFTDTSAGSSGDPFDLSFNASATLQDICGGTGGGSTFNGTISAVNFNSTSDIRFKENVTTIDNALDKVNAIRGVSFDMNDKKQIGVIAQELLEIVPEVVDTSNEDKYTVSYGNLVGLLIEAVKELSDKIDNLR